MNNANRTLIIFSPGFPEDESDSTCLPFLQTFIRSLRRVDTSLNIIVLAFQYPFSEKEYFWEHIRIIPFNGRTRGHVYKLLLRLKIREEIKVLFKENNVIGFFNLWLGECALMGKYASKKYDVPSFTWILGQDAKKDNGYIRKIRPDPGSLIAMSDFLAGNLQENFKIRPLHVIPLGIDKQLFTEPLPDRSIDILGAGSLIPLKQYDVFIKMITLLAKKRPDINALILGEGKEREHLQKMIDENNISNNVRLFGEADHKKVLALMQDSKIFLHPSSYEGFGTVCAEALYAGAKLISFCKPMNRPFKNWFIVETETEMLQQLENILDDSSPVYERVITYDCEEISRQVLALYQP